MVGRRVSAYCLCYEGNFLFAYILSCPVEESIQVVLFYLVRVDESDLAYPDAGYRLGDNTAYAA